MTSIHDQFMQYFQQFVYRKLSLQSEWCIDQVQNEGDS